MSRLLGEFASNWELNGIVSVRDDDDQSRFLDFLAKKPDFEAALLDRIRRAPLPLPVLLPEAPSPATESSASTPVATKTFAEAGSPYPTSLGPGTPSNPMRLTEALKWFEGEADSLGIVPRNKRDIGYTLSSFFGYLESSASSPPAYVHQVGTNHIFSYLKAYGQRAGRAQLVAKSKAPQGDQAGSAVSEDEDQEDGLAPTTLLKRISDLSTCRCAAGGWCFRSC